MAIILIIIVILFGVFENAKDQYDYNKWKKSGGMESRYNCWKNDKKK